MRAIKQPKQVKSSVGGGGGGGIGRGFGVTVFKGLTSIITRY